jgi:exopolyphosphatase / guanosine-5'-triphosphate,3'-diphosphate pyrophosphatase
MDTRIFGAIDIGTNSFHLVIAKIDSRGIVKILSKEKETVRLGKSSTDMKYITPDAMERAVETLKRFKLICDSYKAEIRAVATSATREALNKDEFIQKVYGSTGISVEVVSGFEEARLIYLGVLQSLDVFDKKILLIDIGGGSTEFLTGEKGQVIYANSIKLGAVRLTEKFFSAGKFTKETVNEARLYVRSLINPVVRHLKNEKYETVIGSSGTIFNISMINYSSKGGTDIAGFNFNNYRFSSAELEHTVKTILKCETVDGIKRIEGLDSGRADIISAGTIILEQIFAELNIKEITLSGYALREGIIFDTIDKEHNAIDNADLRNIRYKSIINLAEHCGNDSRHAEKVMHLTNKIFDSIASDFKLDEKDREYAEAAAILHDIGHSISHSQHHRHSYYLIKNSELLGFNNEEIELIANISRYHRKSHPKLKHPEFGKLSASNMQKVRMLAAILRIADGLDRGHNSTVKDIEITIKADRYNIKIIPEDEAETALEVWGADMRKELFEEVFGYKVIIHN